MPKRKFIKIVPKSVGAASLNAEKEENSAKKQMKAAASPAAKSVKNQPYSPPPTGTFNKRCWSTNMPDMYNYHDETWGRPEVDAVRLFESQTLQLMQCGVTWTVVWSKREHFRRAFRDYDIAAVSAFTPQDIEELMEWPEKTIIRNRAKIRAVVANAKIIADMQASAAQGTGPSFAELLWSFCPASDAERLKPMASVSGNHMRTETVAAKSYASREVSDGVHPTKTVCALALELKKKRGFSFMGPTTVLSFMQAVGLVNHHSRECCAFQRNEFEAADLLRWRDAGKPVGQWVYVKAE